MKLNVQSFFIIIMINSFGMYGNNEKFVLITSLYNETNNERMNEYITCLEKNLAHELIDTIHVIYDRSKDDNQNLLLHYLESKPIHISFRHNRPSYGECFKLANESFPERNIILSNADIYFNETLFLLENYNLQGMFLALSRWNVCEDGCLEIFKHIHDGKFNQWSSELSQDVWIFKTPLRAFLNSSMQLGTGGCDSKIAYEAACVGLKVINPCLSIQCCHVHLSGIRHHQSGGNLKNTMPVAWQNL